MQGRTPYQLPERQTIHLKMLQARKIDGHCDRGSILCKCCCQDFPRKTYSSAHCTTLSIRSSALLFQNKPK